MSFPYISNTQLYSDIEELNNYFNELNTKVDNAITGGDIAAPYSYNLLLRQYTTVKTGSTNIQRNDAQYISVWPVNTKNYITRNYQKLTGVPHANSSPTYLDLSYTYYDETVNNPMHTFYVNGISVFTGGGSENKKININQIVKDNDGEIIVSIKFAGTGDSGNANNIYLKKLNITNE